MREFNRASKSDGLSIEGHDEVGALPEPGAAVEALFETDAVLSAIRRLPQTQRQVFALHFDQFETTEIAEILQMKQAAVRQNLARARATLRKLLSGEGEASG